MTQALAETTSQTIEIDAAQYIDEDDCLAAAATEYSDEHGLTGWDFDARWADDSRETILLTVPAARREIARRLRGGK